MRIIAYHGKISACGYDLCSASYSLELIEAADDIACFEAECFEAGYNGERI